MPPPTYARARPRVAAGRRIPLLLVASLALTSPASAAGYLADDHPAPSETPSAAVPLADRLASLVRGPALNPDDTGIAVLLLPGGRPIFTRNADRPAQPASTMKILTSAAALALMKPEFVYQTRIFADSAIDGSGSVTGNLYIQGSGAPDLVGESWWLMARRLAALGLRRVEGDLVADESYFDSLRRPPGWPAPAADSWYNAPIGALSCNFNVVTVTVDPSPLLGARPDLTLEPAASYFQVLNRATTTSGPTSLAVSRSFENGQNALVVGGTIRRGGGPAVFHRSVEEPALYALNAFREIARAEHIEFKGSLTVGTVPEKARELHTYESRPLGSCATTCRDSVSICPTHGWSMDPASRTRTGCRRGFWLRHWRAPGTTSRSDLRSSPPCRSAGPTARSTSGLVARVPGGGCAPRRDGSPPR